MARTWIVGHDLSRPADAAAHVAVEELLGGAEDATLVLVSTVTTMAVSVGEDATSDLPYERDALEQRAEDVERAAEELRHEIAQRREKREGAPEVEVEAVVHAGSAEEAILREAATRDAARICVGTHAHPSLAHRLLGSVTDHIVRRAACPVLVVKADERLR